MGTVLCFVAGNSAQIRCFVSQCVLCQGGESNLLSWLSGMLHSISYISSLSSGTVLLPPQLRVSVPCVLNGKTSNLPDLKSHKLPSKCWCSQAVTLHEHLIRWNWFNEYQLELQVHGGLPRKNWQFHQLYSDGFSNPFCAVAS